MGYDKKRILVVDDDRAWCELVKLLLEDLGYSCDVAYSGEDALRKLQTDDFSIVLLDLNMPGMKGDEVAARLPRRRAPRVVFVTAAATEDVSPALGQGAHYYLPKGAGTDQLSLMLQALAAT